MPTFLARFTYEKAAWRDMVRHPEDREVAARAVIDAAGGRLVAFYWMLGDHDGLAIYEAPDAAAAAAVTVAILASGRIADVRTNALLTSTDTVDALGRARDVARAYQPPGGVHDDWHADFEEHG
ncbi:MAG TPA: GYD domain-containing protein [Miltoncostaeaceae bacterium]|nr:GYD domain-containing protein [Miltoncostaeaceae bacterium]